MRASGFGGDGLTGLVVESSCLRRREPPQALSPLTAGRV